MAVTYNAWLVALSYLIAVVASFTALELGSRVTLSARRAARIWLIAGAFAMGIGIWSMHFVGMLAFHLGVPLAYDVPITLISLVPAVATSALALVAMGRVKTIDGRCFVEGSRSNEGTLIVPEPDDEGRMPTNRSRMV